MDEDAPLELLWQELRNSPLWSQVEKMMIEKRDRMVARLVVEKPKHDEHPGIALARMCQIIGYIEAVNAIVAEPKRQEDKARKERLSA